MQTSKRGLIALSSREGLCLSKYRDSVGVWTIALGATVTEIPDIASWPMDKKITVEEAFSLLQRSIVKYENAINKALKVPVTQAQFDALVSICYNIGCHGAANSTFMKRINAGASGVAISQAIMMWDKPKEIIKRRRGEANQYVTGDYGSTKINVFPVNAKGNPVYAKGTIIDGNDYL